MKSPAKPYTETIADSYSDLKDGKRLPWTAHLLSAFWWLAFLGVSYSVSKKRQYNTIITFVKKKPKRQTICTVGSRLLLLRDIISWIDIHYWSRKTPYVLQWWRSITEIHQKPLIGRNLQAKKWGKKIFMPQILWQEESFNSLYVSGSTLLCHPVC